MRKYAFKYLRKYVAANQHSQNWSFALHFDATFRAAEDKHYNGVDVNS